MVKNLPAMQETQLLSLGQEDPLKKGIATHSSILVWKTPQVEEPGKLQAMGSQRVAHDWVTNTSTTLLHCGKFQKEKGIPGHFTCLLRSLYASQEVTEQDMEQWTGSKLGKEDVKDVYVTLLL